MDGAQEERASTEEDQLDIKLYWRFCVKLNELGQEAPDYRYLLRDKDYRISWIRKARGVKDPELVQMLDQMEGGRVESVGLSERIKPLIQKVNVDPQKLSVIVVSVVALVITFSFAWHLGRQSSTTNTLATLSAPMASGARGTQRGRANIIESGSQGHSRSRQSGQSRFTYQPQKILTLHGSSTIGEKLAPALLLAFLRVEGVEDLKLAETAVEAERRVQGVWNDQPVYVELRAQGSGTAFQSLKMGVADIAMLSRPIRQEENDDLMPLFGDMTHYKVENVIALDGIAVIVHPSNMVSGLTLLELSKLFSGGIDRWMQLGGADEPVQLMMRDNFSGTWNAFNAMVLEPYGHALLSTVQRFESNSQLSDAVAKNPAAVGVVSLPYVRQAKALAVSLKAGEEPTYPSRLTVDVEGYPLTRRLYLYLPNTIDNDWARRFVDFVHSGRGQDVVRSVGFVPLRANIDLSKSKLDISDELKPIIDDAERLSIAFRFSYGDYELGDEARGGIKRLIEYLDEHPNKKLILAGFTDNFGSKKANVRISLERAQSVEKELKKYGIITEHAIGLGPQSPLASNDSYMGRVKNRRVEVWVY